jgi:DNA-binding GntR family transcriptional regulator
MAFETPRMPLYRRVQDELAARLADGRLPRGAQLPTERELCDELSVSRVTVRKALAELRAAGVLESFQGRGTFVAVPRLGEPPNALISFSQLAATGGLAATAKVLSQQVRPATIEEGERFRVAPGTPLFDLERRRQLDGLPVAIARSVVPLAQAPHLPELDWSQASMYRELALAGCPPVRSDCTLEAQAADQRVAAELELAVSAPVLVAESSSYTPDDRLIELSRLVYRGDRYRFRATLLAAAPELR